MCDHHEVKFNIQEEVPLKDFIELYHVFSYAPYNEKWSDEKIEIIYNSMKKEGKIVGLYDDTVCIGIITLTDKNQPLSFENKSLYIADLAVYGPYRRHDASGRLIDYAIEYAKEKGYKVLYLRTLEKGNSLDYDTFKVKNFKKINDKCQVIKIERTRVCKDEDCRIFMRCDIN